MDNIKTTTSVKIKTFLVIEKPYTYEWYGEHTYKVGHRMEIDPRDLRSGGYVMTIGHGMNEIIPQDHFRVEDVEIRRTVIIEELAPVVRH